MKLIAGLGNPGSEYQGTRHNIGFEVLDRLAARHDIPVRKEKFQANYGMGQIGDEKVLLMMPQTYMNLSGESVAPAMAYWKLGKEDLLVLHDELDFELGKFKLVYDAGAAGHRGVRSIIEMVGGKDFYRLRLGIGRPERGKPVDFVLSRFSADQADAVENLIEQAAIAAERWVSEG